MRYAFHSEAEIEFLDAIDYYELCSSGLGYDFAIEVHSTLQNILSFPKAWPILGKDIRRCQLHRFPYGIIYSEHDDIIYILAVMHLHRRPTYWQDRLK